MNHVLKQRWLTLDLLKSFSCLLIVMHHLVVYGTMSKVVYPLAPNVLDVMFQYGRLAVQIFLVVAGFLVADCLVPHGLCARIPSYQPFVLILKRYLRLVIPLLSALTLVIWAAALEHNAAPGVRSLIAHSLLLQDILGIPALSAGIWYVAIDFQLFTWMVLSLYLVSKLQKINGAWTNVVPLIAVIVPCVLSLWVWNRNSNLDMWGIYFIGSYSLGLLAHTVRFSINKKTRCLGQAVLVILVLIALVLAPRIRIFIALITALLLTEMPNRIQLSLHQMSGWQRIYCALSEWSYAIFLVHYSIILIINVSVSRYASSSVLINIGAMFFAFFLSIAGGAFLHAFIEKGCPSAKKYWSLQAGFFASAGLVHLIL